MTDLTRYPERVSRAVAMRLLSIASERVFKRVVDLTPNLAHKLPGEKRAKYRTAVIGQLLLAGVRPAGESSKPKTESRTR